VGFAVEKVALGWALLRVFWFSLVNITAPLLHICTQDSQHVIYGLQSGTRMESFKICFYFPLSAKMLCAAKTLSAARTLTACKSLRASMITPRTFHSCTISRTATIIAPKTTPQDPDHDYLEDCGHDGAQDYLQDRGQDYAEPSLPVLPKTEDFKPLKLLGHGTFGNVFLVRKKGGFDAVTLYAMKKMEKAFIIEQLDGPKDAMLERRVRIMCSGTPFLVGLQYAIQTESKLCLVQNYYPTGDVRDLLEKRLTLTEVETRLYIADVEQLHKLNIIHHDLKPENILIDSDGHVALTDFGLCKEFMFHYKDRLAYSWCGIRGYMAPEIIEGEGHSFEVDWWGLGIMTCEILAGHRPFQIEDGEGVEELYHRTLSYTENAMEFSLEAANLVTRLLGKDPKKRLGTGKDDGAAIKRHQFFHGVNWADVRRRTINMPYVPLSDSENDINCVEDNLSVELSAQLPVTTLQKCDNKFEGYSFLSPALVANGNSAGETS
jgi:serine/threonine protein kinase